MATDFMVRVENTSNMHTLKTSEGDKSSGIAPGIWVLHSGANPIYKLGEKASPALEVLAEDGNPEGLYSALQTAQGVKAVGPYNYIAKPYAAAGYIGPKQAFEFVVPDAKPGDRLSIADMMMETNDWFFATNPEGVELFPKGAAISGDITNSIGLFSAGTEVNYETGAGKDQGPRQNVPNMGESRSEAVYTLVSPADMKMDVTPVTEGWSLPKVASNIKVTITPMK